ncbi:sensor histidine kinase [Dactylosporangium cerinum]|uniref:histidine kinase n=2 Tax=Dactylosporangium cerinum TaxID=1434730 RepID=A0ABV9WFX7_9ACTN
MELATYLMVSEALANATKHSQASMVRVMLATDGATVRPSIRDNGIGGADTSKGTGLVGLQDRVEALGGRMDIVSPRGHGTTLTAEIPYDEVRTADLVSAHPSRRDE